MKDLKRWIKDKYHRFRYRDAFEGRSGTGFDRREFFRGLLVAPAVAATAAVAAKAEPVKEIAKAAEPVLPSYVQSVPMQWTAFTTSCVVTSTQMPGYTIWVATPQNQESGCADTWAMTTDANLRDSVSKSGLQ